MNRRRHHRRLAALCVLAVAACGTDGASGGDAALDGTGSDVSGGDAIGNVDGNAPPDVSAADIGPGAADSDGSDTAEPDSEDPSDSLEEDSSALGDLGEPLDDDTSTDADAEPTSDAEQGLDDTIEADSLQADTVEPPDIGTDSGDPVVFDPALIRDQSTIACTLTNPRTELKDGVLVSVHDVTYQSWESIDGALHPIQIRAFYARPALVSATLPGIVQAHGLGGFATADHATGVSALTGAAVLAFTGPGGGTEPNNTSEGFPAGHEGGYRLFDTLTDVRESWFWGHAVAAMRGLTCLETLPDVDATRLGMTGFSAGGVVTLISTAVDDRIDAAVPLSGSGGWATATLSPTAWQHGLLSAANLTTSSLEWTRLLEAIDSVNLLGGTTANIFMVNGSSDEFFPLTAHLATWNAIGPGATRRTSFAANFDHGCYAISGGESAGTIEARADLRARGAQRAQFRHVFGMDSNYATLPALPAGTLTPSFGGTIVAATVDTSVSKFTVESVKLWFSVDDAFLWAAVDLEDYGGGLYGVLAPATPPNIVWYIDVEYATKGLFPERFSLSSVPSIPAGLVPHIRSETNCL